MRYRLILVVMGFLCLCASPAKAVDVDTARQAADDEVQKQKESAEAAKDETVASATAEAASTAEDEAKKRFWHIALTYEFSHNMASERPSASNSLTLASSFSLPLDFTVALTLAGSVSTDYGRTTSTAGSDASWNYWDTKSLKTFNTVDMAPLGLGVSRKLFYYDFADKLVSLSGKASLSVLIPYVSKFVGQVPKWYFAYKPSVGLSVSVWDFTLSDSLGFQHNFHGNDFLFYELGGSYLYIPLVQYSLSNTITLEWSRWGVSAGVQFGVKRSWKYTSDLAALTQEVGDLDYAESPIISLTYGWEVGYSFAETKLPVLQLMNVALGMTTAGPERRNGGFGSDRMQPLDPEFTSVYLSIGARY